MTMTGKKHPEHTPTLSNVIDRVVPPVVIAITLFICTSVFGEPFRLIYQILLLASVLLAILLFRNGDGWEPFARRRKWAMLASITVTWLILVGLLLLVGYATKMSEPYSRRVLLTWFVVTPPSILVAKLLAYQFLMPLAKSAGRIRTVVIAGANEVGKELAGRVIEEPTVNMRLAGFFDDRSPDRLGDLPHGRILGTLARLPDYVREHRVDVVFIALPIRNVQRVAELIDELFDTTVSIYFLPDIFVFDLIQSRVTDIGGLPAIALCETPFYGTSGIIKRLSDIIIASCLLILLSPLLIAIALIIKATSPGSAIFKQHRYGLDGEKITVYKFRSMRVSEDGAEIKQATLDDPRVTPIGKILRRYSLDELPQLINVLQGRMSMVGPRPHAVAHNEQYRGLIKGYMLRHKVRPGITGLAQIKGCRGETKSIDDMRQRIEYDLDYLRNWSLAYDLTILLCTVAVVLKGDKAY